MLVGNPVHQLPPTALTSSSIPQASYVGEDGSSGQGSGFICAVCNDVAHGMHFGVAACRACAAFFRRSTISNRQYQCRFGGNCDVDKSIRCCCRACRMAKCISLGMKADAVQRHRDHLGPRRCTSDSQSPGSAKGASPVIRASSTSTGYSSPSDDLPSSQASTFMPSTILENGRSYALLSPAVPSLHDPSALPSTSAGVISSIRSPSSAFRAVPSKNPPTPGAPPPQSGAIELYVKLGLSTSSPTPLLVEITKGYRKLCSLRRTTNCLRETNGFLKLFDDTVELTLGTYNDNVTSVKNDLSLVSEMISDHFIPLARFSVDSKWLMLRNFFSAFIMAERAINTARVFPNKDDLRVLISCNHYIQLNRMDLFFDVEGCKGTPAEVAKIFETTFDKLRRLLCHAVLDLQVHDDEIAGIFGVLFWSESVAGLSVEEDMLAAETREAIFEELYYSCRCHVSNMEELGRRFAAICNLIPVVRRIVTELYDAFSVVNILNIFDIDTFLHKLMPLSF